MRTGEEGLDVSAVLSEGELDPGRRRELDNSELRLDEGKRGVIEGIEQEEGA